MINMNFGKQNSLIIFSLEGSHWVKRIDTLKQLLYYHIIRLFMSKFQL